MKNYDIILICPEISKNFQCDLEDFQNKYSIIIFDRLKVGRGKGIFKHIRYVFYNRNVLKEIMESRKFTLIHCVNPPDIIPLITSKLALRKKIPFLFHIADPAPESMATIFNGLKRRLFVLLSSVIEKRIMARSHGIITVNNFLKNQIILISNVYIMYTKFFK